MAKKLFALLLVALMLAPAMLSCNEITQNEMKGADNSPAGEVVSDDPADETKTETEITPTLPEDLNFEGHEFRILNNDYSIAVWSQIDFYA